MTDKELIKRIMEEVKDEKLREELLALVVEKNKKKDNTKQEEERPIDYVARLEILGGATEGVSKVGWWIAYIISIILILAGVFTFLVFLIYTFYPEMGRPDDNTAFLFFSIFLFLLGFGMFFPLRSGKKEYERLKRKSVN